MAVDCIGKSVSRTDATVRSYRKRFDSLRLMAERAERAGGGMHEVVGWFVAQNGRWSASTVRQYRAAILCEMDHIPIDLETHNLLVANCRQRPTPKVGGTPRTSARKRKSLPIGEYNTIADALGRTIGSDDWLLRCFLAFGPILFLRPTEYLSARIEGGQLIVENAKSTNGRANGDRRERDVLPMGPNQITKFQLFVRRLRNSLQLAGSWKALLDRLSSRLARVCGLLGIARVSLYTLRHVGIAAAKTWMTPLEVAAAAGHGSVRTATSHYAKRRSGWRNLTLAGRPSQASLDLVRGTFKSFTPRKIPHEHEDFDHSPALRLGR